MDAIDLYCERTDAGLWAEPLNAASNLAFFIAAFAVWRLLRRERATGLGPWLLLALLVAIGAGSTAFHLFANRMTLLADVIPISLFQLVFVLAYAREAMRLTAVRTAGLVAVFLAASVGCEALPAGWLNGSLGYAPTLAFVLGLGAWHWRAQRRERGVLLAAGAVFALSLVLRSVDLAVCAAFPWGSHFAWHGLNGVVLGLAMRGYV
ncbi:hypothetical protein, partial [Derxia lacustris]|uniref:hypothetical protein n=1 Tax=Derxia lacustris TaxID=764842 RepID=UPI000A171928